MVEQAKKSGGYGEVGGWLSLSWVAMLDNDSAAARAAIDTARSLIVATGMMGAHGASLSFIEAAVALRWGRLEEAERMYRARLAASSQRQGSRNYVDAARGWPKY